MIHPTAHSPRRGDPGGAARRPQSGAPTVRLVHGGVQYREYLKEEQHSQRGCIAGRMQAEFHHGLLTPQTPERKGPAFARLGSSYGLASAKAAKKTLSARRP